MDQLLSLLQESYVQHRLTSEAGHTLHAEEDCLTPLATFSLFSNPED